MLRLIFARKNHRIFFSKIYDTSSVIHGCLLPNIPSNDFEFKARLELTKFQDLTILLVFLSAT